MRNLVFTGRFQPLHSGHLNMIRAIKKNFPEDLLIICIIRNTIEEVLPSQENEFNKISRKKQTKENNPLPNWDRYMLLKLAIDSEKLLSKNTIILFRERSDLDWKKSISDLPNDRVFIFPHCQKEKFDQEKMKYYQQQGEQIEILESEGSGDVSGTKIREQIRNKDFSLEFIPQSCREYFIKNCLKYFE